MTRPLQRDPKATTATSFLIVLVQRMVKGPASYDTTNKPHVHGCDSHLFLWSAP